MDYVKLNKSRHAVKTFDGKKIPTVDVKQIISAASLAPSANNMQTWHFAIVESPEKRAELEAEMHPRNAAQAHEAGAVIVLFSDTDLAERAREIARYGADELDEAQLTRFISEYPAAFANLEEMYEENYLAINAGLVTMNLVYAIKNRGYESNIIMGFNRTSKINEILDIERRYKPELIIVLGNSEDHGKPSYRLPQERIIEIR